MERQSGRHKNIVLQKIVNTPDIMRLSNVVWRKKINKKNPNGKL